MRALLLPLAFTTAASVASAAGTMYAADSNGTLYTMDLTTGAKTMVGTVTANVNTCAGLARDPATGTIWLSSTSNDSLFTLDLATGVATTIGVFSDITVVMHGLEWDSSTGTLYGGSSDRLYVINTATAAVTLIGDSGTAGALNLGYVPATDTLYATNNNGDNFYTVNRSNGALTLVGALLGGSTNANSLAYNIDDGQMYMFDNTADSLFRVDLATGAATLVGASGSGNILGLVYVPDSNPGVAYCFGDGSGTPCPCTPVPLVGDPDKGCPNSFNAGGGKLAGTGVASISADTLVLTCTTINNGGAVIFQGTNDNGGGLGVAFGDGLRCAAGSVRRMRSHPVTTNSHQYPDPAFADNAISIRGAVLAPGDRWYQGWYRSGLAHCDPTQNYNLTNGLKVTWAP